MWIVVATLLFLGFLFHDDPSTRGYLTEQQNTGLRPHDLVSRFHWSRAVAHPCGGD
jgi:hypothetical protein